MTRIKRIQDQNNSTIPSLAPRSQCRLRYVHHHLTKRLRNYQRSVCTAHSTDNAQGQQSMLRIRNNMPREREHIIARATASTSRFFNMQVDLSTTERGSFCPLTKPFFFHLPQIRRLNSTYAQFPDSASGAMKTQTGAISICKMLKADFPLSVRETTAQIALSG